MIKMIEDELEQVAIERNYTSSLIRNEAIMGVTEDKSKYKKSN